MSGRKYSLMALKNAIRESIACAVDLQNTHDRAQTIVQALSQASEPTQTLRALHYSGTSLLKKVKSALDFFSSQCTESSMRRLTIEQVATMRRSMESLRREVNELCEKCRRAGEAAATRASVEALRRHLAEKRDEIKPWLSDEYEGLAAAVGSLILEIDDKIRRNEEIQPLLERTQAVLSGYDACMNTALERQKKNGERKYIAAALEKVCREMGFGTNLLAQSSIVEDLVLEVDTYAYGVIHFRLELEGTVRSQSEMIQASCDSNFKQIENALRELGVSSRFCYEGDQSPVCLKKGEKGLPGGESEPGALAAGNRQ